MLGRALDYGIPVLFVVAALALTTSFLALGIEANLATALISVLLAAVAVVLERVRPERQDFVPLDQPFLTDVAHFFLNYELGYLLAAAACMGLSAWLATSSLPRLWPTDAPVYLQLVLAMYVGEGVSYWQHRFAHRSPAYWRFHALHHAGKHLNFVRTVRFHFVDVGPAAFAAMAPLVLLGAPESVITLYLNLTVAFGVLGHANIRVRAPSLLAWFVCTPAVHRHHHARDPHESDSNFGTMVMLFDLMFGTFQAPRPDGPKEVGIEEDPTEAGFWAQMIGPFRRRSVPPEPTG